MNFAFKPLNNFEICTLRRRGCRCHRSDTVSAAAAVLVVVVTINCQIGCC